MKLVAVVLLFVAPAAATNAELSPITRVVQLLEGLSKKLAADLKMEEDLWDKFACWHKTVVDSKTASNEAAKDRITELEAYIADIEAGKIEFTTERVDLEKEIAGLESEIEEAKNLREKEHEDFVAAKEEMETAIAALEQAVEVLAEVNKEGGEGKKSMLGVKFDLRRVLKVGAHILSKSDLDFVEHFLDGEVPVVDWKKLNRKATFKMKYSSRSKKILALLEDMLTTFRDNLKEAEEKEAASLEAFEKLQASKEKQLEEAQSALTEGAKEGSERGLKKSEAEQEVSDLKAQVEADEGYISDTKATYEERLKEWEARKELYAGEIGAISKAIAILSSDDAKDTFKKSFESQGYLLLQAGHVKRGRSGVMKSRVRLAAAAVREAGAASQDSRLSMLSFAMMLGQGGRFDKVIEAIDKMIEQLEDEEKVDLKNKEDCEQTRMEKTKEARTVSLAVDDATEEISRQKTLIEEQKQQIELKKEEIKTLEEDLKKATEQREDEKAVFEASKADDEAAVDLIANAMEVLKEYYESSGMVLLAASKRQPPTVTAGEAPPPPPPLFEKEHEGGKRSGQGIIAILGLIKEDVERDIEESKAAEEDAIKAFEKLKKDIETSLDDAKTAIADAEGRVADAEKEISDQKEIKATKHESLGATMKEIKAAEPGCDFIGVNFDSRTKNRHLEIDGLKKAKAILQGAEFSKEE